MAYQVKRAESATEVLELVGKDGAVQKRLEIQLSAGTSVEQISAKYIELNHLQKHLPELESSEDKAAVYEQLGDAVIQVYAAAIGEDNTRELLEFFEGSYTEMIQQTLPFVRDVVIPKIRANARSARNGSMQNYNRKQRRLLRRLK